MTPSSSESSIFPNRKLHPTGLVPALLAVCLFALSLLGAWNASRQTEYPPINDVLSYTTKAENVWKELHEGNFTGLLGVEQTIRPFGTSLLGYPLGYSDDFRAFYWRTVAFPACFAALGAFFAALAAGASWRSPSAWLLACLAGMLPMWWSFDQAPPPTIAYWGMMDGMQAGVGVMATGLLLLGWRRNAAFATFAGFFLSAFTLLIKPVGVFLIVGHTIAAGCLWLWSLRTGGARGWRRFLAGALVGTAWCALVGAWCWFSPYFSEANREMGRQALDQLRTMAAGNSAQRLFSAILPSLGIYAIGWTSLLLWIFAMFRFRSLARKNPWSRILPPTAALVLLIQLVALYLGTHFHTARYFLPSLAIFWVLVCPFLWFLLEEFRAARILVFLNAAILSASVWMPEAARLWHRQTGYATFLNENAAVTAGLARAAVDNSPRFESEPVIFVWPFTGKHDSTLAAHQLAEAGGWKEQVLWKYFPRVWEKHAPFMHSHELTVADFLVTISGEPPSDRQDLFSKAIREILLLLNSSDGRAHAPILAEDDSLSFRRIAHPEALEQALVPRLKALGILHPKETGPVPEQAPFATPLAAFQSGDELIDAKAEWVEGMLRITSTWSGTRMEKGHLSMNVAFCDGDGTGFHWITCSLLPPPTSHGGDRYRRTIVDELDCGSFGDRIHSVSLGIYDRYNKAMIPLATPGGEGKAESVSIPLTRILELSTP